MTQLQDFLNTPINRLIKGMGRSKAGDLYGFELECEGKNVDLDAGEVEVLKDWAPHRDGSLRNNHGQACEWVFNGPVKYAKAQERVKQLFEYFLKRKAKLVTSNRTSTHVHFNMGDKNAYQMINMFILFTILEDLMDGYCGDDRRGNLFCLSSRHAEEQVQWISDVCFKEFQFGHIREDWRYCSLNFAALNKFGTVEFRGMRGLDNMEDSLAWLSIIHEFCEYSCYKMKNPITVVESISVKSPSGFLNEVFSKENVARLTQGLTEDQINRSIFEGLRLVQMLCYRIGTEFDQVTLRGKDFWASLSDDVQPDPDLAVEEILGRQAPPPRARGARPLGDPIFRPQAWRNAGLQQADRVLNAGGDMDEFIAIEARDRARRQRAQVENRWVDVPPAPPLDIDEDF